MESEVLAQLARVSAGATLCPGELARRLGTTQRALRPTLAALEARGLVRCSQRGVVRRLAEIRGPYRVARGKE
jgi:DNA-binding transcriptional ArsR family regulator